MGNEDETIKRELVKGKIPALNNAPRKRPEKESESDNKAIKLTANNSGESAKKDKKKCC